MFHELWQVLCKHFALKTHRARTRLHAHLKRKHQKRHPVRSPHNQQVYEEMSLNDHIASWIGDHVGTMTFCYAALALMLSYMLAQSLVMPRLLRVEPFDRYPYPLLFFVVSGFFQTFMLPILVICGNLQARISERRVELDYEATLESQSENKQILVRLSQQDDDAERRDKEQTEMIRSMGEQRAKEEAEHREILVQILGLLQRLADDDDAVPALAVPALAVPTLAHAKSTKTKTMMKP